MWESTEISCAVLWKDYLMCVWMWHLSVINLMDYGLGRKYVGYLGGRKDSMIVSGTGD